MPIQLLERLGSRRPEDLIWQVTQEMTKKSGARDLLIELALELRGQEDDSAIVLENKRSRDHHDPYSPYFSALTLRWDLVDEGLATPTSWVSKGVRIVVSHLGNSQVDLTYNKKDWRRWFSLEELSRLGLETFPQNLEEMSLEEKVRLAMSIAGHVVDYRYGEKKKSPVFKPESKGWQIIFP